MRKQRIRWLRVLLTAECIICLFLLYAPIKACGQDILPDTKPVVEETQNQILLHNYQIGSEAIGKGDTILPGISRQKVTTVGGALILCAGGLILSNHRKWMWCCLKRKRQLIWILFLIEVGGLLFGAGRRSHLENYSYPITIQGETQSNKMQQSNASQDWILQKTSQIQVKMQTTTLTQSLTKLLILSITLPLSIAGLVLTALNIRWERTK